MKIKLLAAVMTIAVLLGLQSCKKEVNLLGNLDFKAVNLNLKNEDGNNVSVNSSGVVSATIVTDIVLAIDGEDVTVNVRHKSNELPAKPGDSIEFTFLPSNAEQTEALFSLPDGSTRKLTVLSPTFSWTVPTDFTEPLDITGESHYNVEDENHYDIGTITVIPIDE